MADRTHKPKEVSSISHQSLILIAIKDTAKGTGGKTIIVTDMEKQNCMVALSFGIKTFLCLMAKTEWQMGKIPKFLIDLVAFCLTSS